MNDNIELQSIAQTLRAISNEKRLMILEWILDPIEHFEPQVDGDLVDDGVCIARITEKVGLSQPTVTNHMQILASADLVSSKKIKNWVFYKPNKDKINQAVNSINAKLKGG